MNCETCGSETEYDDVIVTDTGVFACPNCVCKECGGGGRNGDECEDCDSYGYVDDPDDGGTMTCPSCDGYSGENCLICDGEGVLVDT